MKKNVIAAAFVIFSFFLSAVTDCRAKSLQVVYTDWFPYTFQEKNIPCGFEIDIFKAVIKKMHLTAEYEMIPWKRCLNYLRQGAADVLISMLKTEERQAYAWYPDESVSISKTMFFTKADSMIRFDGTFESLRGYTIGVIMGFSYGKTFDQAEYLHKDGALDAGMLVKKLIGNRNDLAAENEAVVMANAFKMGVADRIKFLEPPIHKQKLYVGFSKAKGHEKLCQDFSISLTAFKKTQEYKDILKNYGISYVEMQ